MKNKKTIKSKQSEKEFVESLTCSDLCFVDFKHAKGETKDDSLIKNSAEQKIVQNKCRC
jgi:hypothetical protein